MAEEYLSSGVDWQQLCPLSLWMRALRLAFGVRPLILASAALLLTCFGCWLGALAFQIDQDAEASLDANLANPGGLTTWPWEQRPPFDLSAELENWRDNAPGWDVALKPWQHLSRPFRRMFNPHAPLADFAYRLVCGVWTVAVWALFGGAIARGAAVAIAHDEYQSWGQVLRYSRGKWLSLLAAPMLPLLGISLLTVPLATLGLVMRADIGILLAGIVWPLVLLAAAGMAVLALGLLFSWPLMWATIGAEGTDAFDAVSRSFAYVYSRPLHYLFYALQAALLGLVGWLLINLCAATLLTMASWGLSWGHGKDAFEPAYAFVAKSEIPSGMEAAGAALVRFWTQGVWTLVAAFVYSYLFTAATAIYFVLRRQVDATETDEVFLAEAGETFGLPPLVNDAAGVPTVTDMPGAAGAKPGEPSTQG